LTADGSDAWVPSAAAFVDEMSRAVVTESPPDLPILGGLIAELARVNLRQWDCEDTTRDAQAGDAAVARAKRAIDELNLNRHRLVHEIDVALSARLDQREDATLATESPGMILDRLSVLVIRRARTVAASSRDRAYADRVPVLDAQLASLVTALDAYLEELRSGTRRFLAYDALKLYLRPPDRTREDGNRPG
jgi:hypothetical protein